HMDGMIETFRRVVEGLKFSQPRLAVVSNLTGRLVTAEELVSPGYWVRQVRQAVRFVGGVRAAEDAGGTAFLECGPRGVLCGMAAACVRSETAVFAPSLRKGAGERDALIMALGELHA